MRPAAKIAFAYVMVALLFTIMIPEAGVGKDVVETFVDLDNLERSENLNQTLPEKSSGILSQATGFLSPVEMVWKFIQFVIDLMAFPINLVHYLKATGAPAVILQFIAVGFVAMAVVAIADFVRG